MWAGIMRAHFKANNPRSWMLRFHTQTAGSTLTAQQPENNIVRTALQALAAVSAAPSPCTLIPTTRPLLTNGAGCRIALRTQQIVAYESGVPQTVDPLAGSYYIESLTNESNPCHGISGKIEALGGMIKALEHGYVQQEIQNAAYEYQQQVDREEAVVVGVNRFAVNEEKPIPFTYRRNPELKQVERLRALRARRDQAAWQSALQRIEEAPAPEKILCTNSDRGRSQRHGRRDLRHHEKSLRRVQRGRVI